MRKDITGKRFGKLTALSYFGQDGARGSVWTCICDCGTIKQVHLCNLGWSTNSCGCVMREKARERLRKVGLANRIHGMDGTPEHRTYCHAKERCTNPNNHNYRNYGGRGIEFRFTSFEQFYAELGPKPSGMSIDRIDVNGHYEPGNVRWATAKEQANNRRINREALSRAGRLGCLARWAKYREERRKCLSQLMKSMSLGTLDEMLKSSTPQAEQR